MSLAIAAQPTSERDEEPLVPPSATDESMTAMIADSLLTRGAGRGWWIAMAIAAPLTLVTVIAIWRLLAEGIGLLGNNTTVVWGVPIANYVWWIGIGNAGTLISALLLLTRQR